MASFVKILPSEGFGLRFILVFSEYLHVKNLRDQLIACNLAF